ncbi:endonuclease/exonuclease/phosphatase family protein [Enterococcus sp. DIV1298c]|uniref:endonuclease/exonuclease/phosphatase family protein n=1 Tax=Enterococcus sp. DIV1298c TaxID=2815328 RepID=UPI001A9375D3|nr:endonuclease/exonuclease/phosphatase family protein [Enterococcus sp. DIV1298c]MBO0462436.1 endonuclease/exonuclease/phosphatase family protein [Enterococcus sp. DIV1298c]
MKVMTLNTHSWLEEDPFTKLQELTDKIVAEGYDVIALQEVNQLIQTNIVNEQQLVDFCPVMNQTPIHEDNFAYCLVQRLAEAGEAYFWSWEMSHIGYDKYEEGNAILSKTPLDSRAYLVSETKEKENYRTRMILVAKTVIENQPIVVASCHFSWWSDAETGFAYEWQFLQKQLLTYQMPCLLMGDFNNPVGEEGYRLVAANQLKVKDSYLLAEQKSEEATIEKKIDGWENNTEALRIDYIFVPMDSKVSAYTRIFDGTNGPIVSDHFGVAVEMER